MQNVFLKPTSGPDGKPLVVPDPDTHVPLKAEGEWKPHSMYWARRILDKDVEEATPPAPPKASSKREVRPPPPDTDAVM